MKQHLVKGAVGAGGIFLCGLMAHSVANLRPMRGSLELSLGVLGVFVALFGLQSRRAWRWQLWDFLFGFVGAEVVAGLLAVMFALPPAAPWRWFAVITLFVAPPWVLGYGLGSVSLVAAEKERPVFARSWVIAAVYAVCGVALMVLIPQLRHSYGQFAVPLPRPTLLLVRLSPELWFFLALGFAAFAVSKDLVFRQRWVNLILPLPLVPVVLGLFLPLV